MASGSPVKELWAKKGGSGVSFAGFRSSFKESEKIKDLAIAKGESRKLLHP
jgi:hypothetical protein